MGEDGRKGEETKSYSDEKDEMETSPAMLAVWWLSYSSR